MIDDEQARLLAPCDCPGGGDGIDEPRGHTDECASWLQPGIATALADMRRETRTECETIAKKVADAAIEGEKQDREFLGDSFDMNSYGSGHNNGERDAAYRIANLIRALHDKPASQGDG